MSVLCVCVCVCLCCVSVCVCVCVCVHLLMTVFDRPKGDPMYWSGPNEPDLNKT